jgi:hypothetical protein
MLLQPTLTFRLEVVKATSVADQGIMFGELHAKGRWKKQYCLSKWLAATRLFAVKVKRIKPDC